MKFLKRRFTLIEVLIALLLIMTAFPLLMQPYFYARAEMIEMDKKRALHRDTKKLLADVLIQIRTGKLKLEEDHQEFIAQYKLYYSLKKLEESERVSFWEVIISKKGLKDEEIIDLTHFPFLIVKQGDETSRPIEGKSDL